MQQTYQARLTVTDEERRWLEASGALYGRTERRLYGSIARGTDASKAKAELMAEFGLTARQYNALRISLQGKITGTVELLTERKKDLTRQLANVRRALKRLARKFDEIRYKTREVPRKRYEQMRRERFNKTQREASLERKLEEVNERLAAPVPGICFGSRKLFRQQFHLTEAGYGSHAEWLADWRAARNHQFFLVGSKDETAGNQSCKALVQDNGTLTLQVRMAPKLIARGAPVLLEIKNVAFPYGHEVLLCALLAGDPVALSYRFHRDEKGWRVFVSLDVQAVPLITVHRRNGQLGVDFNEDHLAWARTDACGNIVDAGSIALHLMGKSSEQREAILSNALDIIIRMATEHRLGIALEDLDFAKKKRELARFSDRYARMLSGLGYAKYKALAQAKCARAGIELTLVDPAYTSVAGRVKYAVSRALTVHQAAAGVVARRSQGFREKLPHTGKHRVPVLGLTAELALPERNRCERPRKSWSTVSRKLAQLCAGVAREAGKSRRRRRRSSSSTDGRRCHAVRPPARASGTQAGKTVRPVPRMNNSPNGRRRAA